MAGSRKDRLSNYECEGQLSIFEIMKPVCSFSGHTCNKQNLWEIADTLDALQCPHVCCRKCNTRLCGARCNGSEEPAKVYPVEIKGLMDDAYCPKCGYEFWETRDLDCDRCPSCGIRVDWTPWHQANDEEVEDGNEDKRNNH